MGQCDLNKTSILSKKRREEISALMSDDFRLWKASCGGIWRSKAARKIDPKKPSWATFSTTNPVMGNGRRSIGVRGCIAFHKVPCVFKKKTNGIGCTHCSLSMGDQCLSRVKPSDQIFATEIAIDEITRSLGYTPPVIELLTNGSSLNDEEISPETRTGVFSLMARNDSILKFAIESRPEYISAPEIKRLLNLLRKDQVLEIYIGLESVDPFVLGKIIKKGFTVNQFEKKTQKVADSLSPAEKSRLCFSVYHFFKPPYLTEKESIEAAVVMGKKIKSYEANTGIHFSVKYEPTVISDGTFQQYLFNRGKFTPPNYFSIAEIIARSYEEKFSDKIKFGQRDDIDDFQTVAAISDIKNPKMFSPYDYMVYNAVQRFNADQDIFGFCADMSDVIENASEFKRWEKENFKQEGTSALSRLFAEYKSSGFEHGYQKRIEFQRKIWRILGCEYDENLSKQITEQGEKGKSRVKAELITLFLQADIKVLQIKNIKLIDIGKIIDSPKLQNTHPDFADATEDAVFQVEVIIENEVGLPQNIWSKIPLKAVEYDLKQFVFLQLSTT